MPRLRLCLVFLILLLVAAPFPEVSQAQDSYTVQEFTTNTVDNSINYLQGISGWSVSNFSENGSVFAGFNNVTINGIYNLSAGMGSFRNQGFLAFVNILPDEIVPPATLRGFTFSANNDVTVNDYNYSVHLSLNNFKGSGILVLNLMAGSFSNQFTSVNYTVGQNTTPSPSPTLFWVPTGQEAVAAARQLGLNVVNKATVATLTNDQMQAIAATADNNIDIENAKMRASASVEGTPQVNGLCVITLSAGVNNLVSHNVRVNFNTAK
jgi:hypothetical protein